MEGGLNIDNIQILLGRKLTPAEFEGFDVYLGIAITKLCDVLCLETLPNPLPCDLAQVLAGFFAAVASSQLEPNNIERKRVEDFEVTYRESQDSAMASIVKKNLGVIAKYSACKQDGAILHGKTLIGDSIEEDCCCGKVID